MTQPAQPIQLHRWLSIAWAAPQVGRFFRKCQHLRCRTARRSVPT